jgi:hypothetical protein
MRIYNKLIIAFLLLSVIPAIFIGVIGFYNTKNILEKSIISNLNNIAVEGVKEIEAFVSARKSDIMELQRQSDEYMAIFTDLDKSGLNQLTPYSQDAEKTIEHKLAALQKSYKYVDVRLADRLGRVVYDSDPNQKDEFNKYTQDIDDILKR